MLNVVKDFAYNGTEYLKGGQVSPALFEVDDLAALFHGGFVAHPGAPLPDIPVVVEKDEPEQFFPADSKKAKRGKK